MTVHGLRSTAYGLRSVFSFHLEVQSRPQPLAAAIDRKTLA